MDRKSFLTNTGVTMLGLTSLKLHAFQLDEPKITNFQSWQELRSFFPLAKDIRYLNNGTMGLTPSPVIDAVAQSLKEIATKGHYPTTINLLREPLAKQLGVVKESIAITKNVTEGINIACWSQNLKKGDEILMTKHEHVGGCAAWIYRSTISGIKIKTFELASTAEETLHNFKKAITKKTRVIAVPHIPCTIGQILPVKEICSIAREKGIVSIIDGAHPLGMISIDISDIGCDYYAGCLHKWLLAPLGLGFVYIRPEMLENSMIYNIGAYGIQDFDITSSPPSMQLIHNETGKYSTGSYSASLYAGGVAALDFYQSIGPSRVEARVKELSLILQTELRKFSDDILVHSPIEEISRSAITTFSLHKKKTKDFLGFMRSKDFVLRYVNEAKLDAVRVSTHYYNTEAEIIELIRGVRECLKA